MPPKRRGAAAKGTPGKKAKVDNKVDAPKRPVRGSKKKVEEDEPAEEVEEAPKKTARGRKKKVEEEVEEVAASISKDAINKLMAADAKKPKKNTSRKPDSLFPNAVHATVHENYDCMLNQTNIGNNNNKFYVIQVLHSGSHYCAFNRWGRVGEPGQQATKYYVEVDGAIKDFEKKFKDKTRNNWADRDKFKAVPGKYTLIEMDVEGGGDDIAEKLQQLDETDGPKPIAQSKLNKPTQDLVRLIFDHDMFKQAMAALELDVKKMPLGKLSKAQVAKGFEALEAIEEVVEGKKKGNLADLTSKFYTIIPHSFGRQRPPVIATLEVVRKKYDMLAVLGDIVIAQNIQQDAKKASLTSGKAELPNPLDINYGSLSADLEHVDKKSDEFKMLETYTKNTSGGWRTPTITDVWKVNRHDEDKRFAAHNSITNRKLLWHGTNVAVVAAIMKGGLRIMPHSGGRVGKGIYFASENSKSAGYVGCIGKTGIMFLAEVALGKEHHITRDDHTLNVAPGDSECVIAKGWTEPDPKLNTTTTIDGKTIVVPQGKPITMKEYSGSSFSQSEYLVYKESQHRIRYLFRMEF